MSLELVVIAVVAILGVAIVAAAVTAIAALRTLSGVSARADAQVSRLMVLARVESMAEFAALEKQMAKERLEAARTEPVEGELPLVARSPDRRSNPSIWGRRKRQSPAPEGEKE